MNQSEKPFKRRVRYSGKNPRRFEDKYKELDPDRDPDTIAKVIASGKTPAGQHRPIMVEEILAFLDPKPGQRGADVTFGYGGHSQEILEKGARLLALDVDPVQLPRTEERLRSLGFDESTLLVRQSNYAGLANALSECGWRDGVDFLLADLGLSSMQIDNPERGFSYKNDGPLDMRMNPARGLSARAWIKRTPIEKIARALRNGADEPRSERIAKALAKTDLATTHALRHAVCNVLPASMQSDEIDATIARVFQAVRIAVNEEFTALDAFLQRLPSCLKPCGRVAILSFHSGEDRRVKLHFRDGFRNGIYSEISEDIIRPSRAEMICNTRATPAKLRWAIRCR